MTVLATAIDGLWRQEAARCCRRKIFPLRLVKNAGIAAVDDRV